MTSPHTDVGPPQRCDTCGLCFSSGITYEMHRMGRSTKECLDVRSELAWRVDGHGCWTTSGHRSNLPNVGYIAHDQHHRVGYGRNRDDPAGGW